MTTRVLCELKSIAFYEKSKNLYANVILRDPIRLDYRLIEDTGAKISVLIQNNDFNRLQTAKLIASTNRLATFSLYPESRSEIEDKFENKIGRYSADSIEFNENFRL